MTLVGVNILLVCSRLAQFCHMCPHIAVWAHIQRPSRRSIAYRGRVHIRWNKVSKPRHPSLVKRAHGLTALSRPQSSVGIFLRRGQSQSMEISLKCAGRGSLGDAIGASIYHRKRECLLVVPRSIPRARQRRGPQARGKCASNHRDRERRKEPRPEE